MVYFLFDNPADKNSMDFLNQYSSTASFKLIFPPKQCKTVIDIIKICFSCIQKSKEEDTFICWYDFMGIVCWWLCKILHRQRKIIVLNILLKFKHSIKNLMAKILYRIALQSPNVKATVTSMEYGQFINRMFYINKKYTVLHDLYHDRYHIEYNGEVNNNSVFCGGRNGRDWDFVLELASKMPDIQFNIVAPKIQMKPYKNKFKDNVNIKTEISESDFLNLLCHSSVVLVPLNTEAPAGLITMFQAAANKKLIITSDTMTTREYFSKNRGVLCRKSFDAWEKQIRYWLEHEVEAQDRATELKKFLETECSEQKYAQILGQLVKE